MFDFLLPIFCFGSVVTGGVLLGVYEASKQAKLELARARAQAERADRSPLRPIHPGRFELRRFED